MRSYVRPVLCDAAIRRDGRKAIGGVGAAHVRTVAARLGQSFSRPVLCAWAADDRVFPLARGERYARALGADLRTVPDSYTYTAEDQPRRTAEVLRAWLSSPPANLQLT